MDKAARNRERGPIRAEQSAYLATIVATPYQKNFEKRFKRIQADIRDLLRKEAGSENSLKLVPMLARDIFGVSEDITRLKLPSYPFGKGIELLNRYVVAALDRRRSTQYDGQCGSYGETLLNCYLDLFVTLTVFKTPREIEAKPSFLVNPATGSVLELDILLEDFRLAFEFQGEHHYVSPKVIAKDAFKLAQCARFERILIPVNPAQLASTTLQTLILNSIKDHLGLGGLFSQPSTQILPGAIPSPRALLAFSKAVQRIYLSRVVFFDALTWCDGQSATYLASTTPAPRFIHTTPDVDIETIYRRLPAVTSLRKSLTTVQRTHG